MQVVIKVAKDAGREARWKGLVGAAVGRCWVRLGDTQGEERDRIEQRLRAILLAMGDERVGHRLAGIAHELDGLSLAVAVSV